MAALLPTATSVPSQKIQQDLDANFDAFMDAEYADDQIGELEEEVENEDIESLTKSNRDQYE